MTKIEQSRKAWQEAYKKYGKGSPEEIAAYREYVNIYQGRSKGKGKTRSYLEGKKVGEKDVKEGKG